MSDKAPNPPAFPEPFVYHENYGESGLYRSSTDAGFGGMTLRDYFAAKAMAGMLSCEQPQNTPTVARVAYELADAMLAERIK